MDQYPNVKVLTEGAGSATTIRKVTELEKECGIIASADYSLIPELMYPNYADWYIIFATNQMCICYTDESAYADEITSDNWYEILRREGVTDGRSDPDQDPCGYRTLMVWQLAEKHYGVSGIHSGLYDKPDDIMRPKSVELIALLESGTTITMTGSPIVYGLTIPSNFPNKELAIAWIEVMLGKTGIDIMNDNGQPPVVPALTDSTNAVPAELRSFLK